MLILEALLERRRLAPGDVHEVLEIVHLHRKVKRLGPQGGEEPLVLPLHLLR